jgi:hypothetical protein
VLSESRTQLGVRAPTAKYGIGGLGDHVSGTRVEALGAISVTEAPDSTTVYARGA